MRLNEALTLAWDADEAITPVLTGKGLPYLHIPARMQKNRKAQDVPTTPAFAAMLMETSEGERTGFIFCPKQQRRHARPMLHKTSRTISAIGRAANIVVNATGKAASAHDLRRSFGQRLADAGLPPRDLQCIMRHSSFTTTEAYYLRDKVQDQAKRIAMYLGTSEKMNEAEERKKEAANA